jgi:16S rRNA G966 N2-methylase RsmD
MIQSAKEEANEITNEIKQEVIKIIGDKTHSNRVLDIYSGLGIEALIQGAQRVEFVEPDHIKCNKIRRRLNKLGFSSYARVFEISAFEFSEVVSSKYDLIFVFLPGDELNLDIIRKLSSILKKNGILVYSCPKDRAFPSDFDHTRLKESKVFVNKRVVFIQRY